MDPARVEQLRARFGLDRPLPEQYVRYVGALLHGDMGESFGLHRPVVDALRDAIPNTLALAVAALLIDFTLGLALGVYQAARACRVGDVALGNAALFVNSMPTFWLGLVLLLVFAQWLHWFPVGGTHDPVLCPRLDSLRCAGDRLWHLMLPALTLGLVGAAGTARYQRAAVLEAIGQDFVRTARAKGLSERRILLVHALRNALLPFITLFGLAFPFLLTGAVLVETVFAWPGMGRRRGSSPARWWCSAASWPMSSTRWPTLESGCAAHERVDVARPRGCRSGGARGRGGGPPPRGRQRRRPALLPPPDRGAGDFRARVLRDDRARRTRGHTVRALPPDRHRAPRRPAAVGAVLAGHRPLQPRCVEPPRVRGAHLPGHRRARDAGRRHGRRGRGRRGRVLSPRGRRHVDAARRRGPRPAPHLRPARGRGAVGARSPRGARAAHRAHRLVRHEPPGARGGAVTARARVRGGGARAGRGPDPRHRAPRPAQRRRPDHRIGGARHRQRNPARGGALVPRDRRPLAGAELGQHDRRRVAEDRRRAVGRDLSGRRHLAGRHGAQRRGRRAARRARPAQGRRVTEPLLRVRDLKTYFVTEQGSGTARGVDGVSFAIHSGETLGLVGESGCGKTVTSLSILRLIPEPPGHIRPGSFIEFEGRNLLALEPRELRAIRGNRIAMIFQEPMTSLNPVFTVGDQIAEAAIVHQKLTRRAARARAIEMLRLVAIPDPAERVDHYPHQMSGGMRQRVMIAMALVCHPKVLIADEPTTALDVTIQAQILELLRRLQAELGMAVMLITHDLGLVAGSADRVVVMYAGQVVEQAPTRELFARPLHPYTEGLLASVPRLDTRVSQVRGRLHSIPGQVPAATAWPEGCRFHPRCPYAWDRCRAEAPPLLDAGGGAEPGTHTVRCWLLTDPRRRTPHP